MTTESIIAVVGAATTIATVIGGLAWAVNRLEREVDGVRKTVDDLRTGPLAEHQDGIVRLDEQVDGIDRRVGRLEEREAS